MARWPSVLFLLHGGPLPEPGTQEARELAGRWAAATEPMAEAGVLIDCAPLQLEPQRAARAFTVGRIRHLGRSQS